jgi:predicted RND superfamily exporter protein
MNEKIGRYGLYVIVLLTLLCAIPLRSLRFEFNIEKLFPQGDPDLAFFRQFREQFHSDIDDEFIFVALRNEKGLLDTTFLKKADTLTRFLQALPLIRKVYSLTSSSVLYFENDRIEARPLIHWNQPDKLRDDSLYLFRSPEYRDLLVSKDGRSMAIAAFNEGGMKEAQKDTLIERVRHQINSLHFDETHFTAKILVERIYVTEIEKNLKRYLLIALTLISLCLYLLFRSWKAMLFPLAVIGVSVCWTLSLIPLTGNSLDIISSLIPPILAAICMSDVIHLSSHYIEHLRNGIAHRTALEKAFREAGLATFLTCTTVATGFFSLGMTNVLPIRNFGFLTGTGILLSFGITLTGLYAYYYHSSPPEVHRRRGTDRWWNRFLNVAFITVMKNRKIIFLSMGLILAASLFFIRRIKTDASLLQEIPRGQPILEDYRFMEESFSGTRPFEMNLTFTSGRGDLFQVASFHQLEKLESFLGDSCGIGFLISPVSLFKGANKALHGGSPEQYRIPETNAEAERCYEGIRQTQYAEEMQHYLLEDGKQLRISGRLPNLSAREFEIIQQRIDRYMDQPMMRSVWKHKITGSAVLLDKINFSLTENLFSGILIDVLVISLIAFLLLRKWQMMLIAMIPNIIPLFIMGGLMGLLKINLKADTSVIFAIALGIAVDDTIHFLSRFRIELQKGLSVLYALKRTYLSTGKAIIITTLVLVSGFGTLLSSSFGGTFYIGLLISSCLASAMVLELTLTPVLIYLFYPVPKNS